MTRRGDAGFSLLELLVAVGLTTLLVATAAGGLRFGARVWDRAADVSEAAIEDRALRRFLRATIEALEPIHLRDGSRDPALLFEGRPDRLLAAVALPGALAPTGPHLIALAFEPRDDGLALTLRWRPLGPGRPPAAFTDKDGVVLLATRLDAGGFAYVGTEGRRDIWRGADAPLIIEVSLGADRPALAAAPRLMATP